MELPQNRPTRVPATKKGPKGTSDFKFFFLKDIKANPTRAPLRKAKNKATKMLGQPKRSPIKKTSFTSPIPIHLPFDKSTTAKKKAEAKKDDKTGP